MGNMKLSVKIMGSFGLVALITLMAAYLSFSGNRSLLKTVGEIRTQEGKIQPLLAEMRGLLEQSRTGTQQLFWEKFQNQKEVSSLIQGLKESDQKWLDRMTLSEAKKLYQEGHFLSGSMGPKIEAIIAFLEANPQGQALVTKPETIIDALDGKTGTWIVPD